MTLPKNIASLAIDAQPTFCEGGGLGVAGGHAIMPKINQIRSQTEKGYWTQDWHPAGHSSFASTHGRAPFTTASMINGQIVADGTPGAYTQKLWTDHGIQGTAEAELHPDLVVRAGDMVVKKGTNPLIDSYSCVFENDKVTHPRFPNGNSVTDQLRTDGIDTVVVSGIALDVCVRDGACDLRDEGFRVVVVLDATAAITPEGQAATLDLFKKKGVEVTTLDQLASYFNPPSVTAAPRGPVNDP
ncbi:MAG: nicotinamidase [Micavibrio sp.]|nr:nicotinamidase [Micavibrio sp.]